MVNRWKRWLCVALAAVLMPLSMAAQAREAFSDDPAAMERAAQSVVKVEVYDARDQKIATGSAFAAFDPPVLVTACHVIVNMAYMLVYTEDGASYRVDGLLNLNDDTDVALAKLPPGMEIQPLPWADAPPMRGEKATAIGCQFGIINLITLGNVSGRWKTAETDWILFTAPIAGGSSGGPLLNDRGQVIGVITGAYDKGQSLNLAAPMEAAWDLYHSTWVEGGNER